MQSILSQKDLALVGLAEEVALLYRSGYPVDAAVAILLCLGYVKSPKAEERILNAMLDLTRRDLQPTEIKPHPLEEARYRKEIRAKKNVK